MDREKMTGIVLPGDSTVEFREYEIPEPGPGEVLIKMKSSTICGSDIRAIYREHLGTGAEAYQGVICGHEPSGQVAEAGAGCRRFREGDRVVVYHISGCGLCHDCRMGYMISCTSERRAAYGWQRDGGMAEYLLAEEKDLVLLPDELSYTDGSQIACGFGTSFEGLGKIGIGGADTVLVVGLGPVGLATLMLARALGAARTIGVDLNDYRLGLAREKGLADLLIKAGEHTNDEIMNATAGRGCSRSVDCSGSAQGRLTAIRGTAKWGRVLFLGEGGEVRFRPSEDIMHKQISIHGSWVTSVAGMEDLVDFLVARKIRPERLITHRFALADADEAYRVMAEGNCGKVAVVFDEKPDARAGSRNS